MNKRIYDCYSIAKFDNNKPTKFDDATLATLARNKLKAHLHFRYLVND